MWAFRWRCRSWAHTGAWKPRAPDSRSFCILQNVWQCWMYFIRKNSLFWFWTIPLRIWTLEDRSAPWNFYSVFLKSGRWYILPVMKGKMCRKQLLRAKRINKWQYAYKISENCYIIYRIADILEYIVSVASEGRQDYDYSA